MLSHRIVVDLHVAVNSMKVLGVIETLEWVPFPLLSATKHSVLQKVQKSAPCSKNIGDFLFSSFSHLERLKGVSVWSRFAWPRIGCSSVLL